MKKLVITLLGTAAAVVLPSAASAQSTGTLAGTSVNNTATIGYSSGGVAQAPIDSNVSTFVVDEKINLTVAELGGTSTIVGAGGTSYATAFTVTNLSNATQDFALTGSQDATGSTTAFNNTDGFNLNNLAVYVDDGDGIYEPGIDVLTFIDELAPNQSVTVFIVGNVPTGTADGLFAGVNLTAQAANDGVAGTLGTIQSETVGGDTGGVDIVFADTAGDGDAIQDGRHSDDDQYLIAAPAMALQKLSTLISDPINGTTNPHRIPGAVVEYCIVATNGGSGDAALASITDNLANVLGVTYVPGSLLVGATASGSTCSGGTPATDSGTDTDGGSVVSNLVTGNLGTLAAGASSAIRFRVTIN